MRTISAVVLWAVVVAAGAVGSHLRAAAPAEVARPSAKAALPRSTPAAEGVDAAKVVEFLTAADARVNRMHSFMLLRHDKVIAECWWGPEAPDKPHVLWSLSKSFTSTAVGLAVAEGKLRLDDKVLSFFPEEAPAEPSENLRAMTVRDLLTMATGHDREPKFFDIQEPLTRIFLAHPVPRAPGSKFLYNTPATYMQSAIVQKVTGQTVLEYLRPRLWEPLGIEAPRWDASPEGITLGGYGLYLRTEEIAKFGQLYLQRGQWNGKQLIPAEWIALATRQQVANASSPDPEAQAKSDWQQGYGFQFWRCRHGAYRGDGKDGQFCIVLPAQDAVVVMTAQTRDMQAQLNLVWEHLLPAMQAAALPEDRAAQQRLSELCAKFAAGR